MSIDNSMREFKLKTFINNPIVIFVLPVVWVIVFVKFFSNTEMKFAIAEGVGGSLVILLIPMIITVLIWLINKKNGISYPDFVKHTFIGTVIMFSLALYVQLRHIENLYLNIVKCELGNGHACGLLGNIYTDKENIDMDIDIGLAYYKKACQNGYLNGCKLYTLHNTVIGYDYYDKEDYENAVIYLKNGCDTGNTWACQGYGTIYYFDDMNGIIQDYQKAKEAFEKGCNGGEAESCRRLGYIYEYGKGTMQDYQKASLYYEKGCGGNDAIGCYSLGILYDKGNGVYRDREKALQLYIKACDKGLAGICYMVGLEYLIGEGIQNNYTAAKYYLKKGCDGGDLDACKKYRELTNNFNQ